jgi:hypothetical protein
MSVDCRGKLRPAVLGSFLLGLALGVLFHYSLYRISLPAKPFIYFAF